MELVTPLVLVHAYKILVDGEIELDVASNEVVNKRINAERFYEADGLAMPWEGQSLLIHPPCGSEKVDPVILKRNRAMEYQQIVQGTKDVSRKRIWYRETFQRWIKGEFHQGLFVFAGLSKSFVHLLTDSALKRHDSLPMCLVNPNTVLGRTDQEDKQEELITVPSKTCQKFLQSSGFTPIQKKIPTVSSQRFSRILGGAFKRLDHLISSMYSQQVLSI